MSVIIQARNAKYVRLGFLGLEKKLYRPLS